MRVVVGVVALLTVVAAPARAFAQNLLIWEDQVDFAGSIDLGRDVTVAGRTMIMAGVAADPAGGADIVVRAHDVRSGAVLWTDHTPEQSGQLAGVFVTSAGDMAFAAGYMTSAQCSFCTDIFVRAYDATTGLTLWQDSFDRGRDDFPRGIAASSRVVVVITVLDSIVRAYDPTTGAFLWEDRVVIDAAARANAVAIDGDRVFVAVETLSVPGLILRAYDAATGELVWELRRPTAVAAALSVDAGLVFVAGVADPFLPSAFLGAFDATDGHLRWEDTSDLVGNFSDVKTRRRQLVAVGHTGTGALVRVYDAATGVVRWEDVRPLAPGLVEIYGSVDVSNKAIYVAGTAGESFGNRDFLVRAFDLRNGALLLDDRSHSSGRFGSFAAAIAVDQNRVFAVGSTFSETSSEDFLTRAYNVKDIEAPGRRSE